MSVKPAFSFTSSFKSDFVTFPQVRSHLNIQVRTKGNRAIQRAAVKARNVRRHRAANR